MAKSPAAKSKPPLTPALIRERIRIWSLVHRLHSLNDPWVISYWFTVADGITHALHRSPGRTSIYTISDGKSMVAKVSDHRLRIRPVAHRDAIVKAVRQRYNCPVPDVGTPTHPDAEKVFNVGDRFTFCAAADFGSATWTEVYTGETIELARWPLLLTGLCQGTYKSFLRKWGYEPAEVDRFLAAIDQLSAMQPITAEMVKSLSDDFKPTAARRRQIREIARHHVHPCEI